MRETDAPGQPDDLVGNHVRGDRVGRDLEGEPCGAPHVVRIQLLRQRGIGVRQQGRWFPQLEGGGHGSVVVNDREDPVKPPLPCIQDMCEAHAAFPGQLLRYPHASQPLGRPRERVVVIEGYRDPRRHRGKPVVAYLQRHVELGVVKALDLFYLDVQVHRRVFDADPEGKGRVRASPGFGHESYDVAAGVLEGVAQVLVGADHGIGERAVVAQPPFEGGRRGHGAVGENDLVDKDGVS